MAVSLLTLTILLPPVTLRAVSRPAVNEPACSSEQRPFVIEINRGSYIDLVQAENVSCGLAPNVCYNDFLKHNTEIHIDDFYQQLDTFASTSQTDLGIIPTINLLDGYFQYFVIPDNQISDYSTDKRVSGCATRIQTENQRIFLVESISMSDD